MSAYHKRRTTYTSRQTLQAALKATGIPFEECQPGQEKNLVGYHGDVRPETASFIVRRAHIGASSNDLGYRWDKEAKCFTAIVSEFDEHCSATTRIRGEIRREYAVADTITQARKAGYKVERKDLANGTVQMVVTGRI